jgi:hypothetical protein
MISVLAANTEIIKGQYSYPQTNNSANTEIIKGQYSYPQTNN